MKEGYGSERKKNIVYEGQWKADLKHGFGYEITYKKKKKNTKNQVQINTSQETKS